MILTKFKQYFPKPNQAADDPYSDLTEKVMDLLGKEMAPLFCEIRQKFYDAVFSIPFVKEYDHPFGLYRSALDTVLKALVEKNNNRFTVCYYGQKKENTFRSWAEADRSQLLVAIENLFVNADYLLTFTIRSEQNKGVIYNFYSGIPLKTFYDDEFGITISQHVEPDPTHMFNSLIFVEIVKDSLRDQLIETIGQESFLYLLTRIDKKSSEDIKKFQDQPYCEILSALDQLIAENALVIHHKDAKVNPNIFILEDVTVFPIDSLEMLAKSIGSFSSVIIAKFLQKNVLKKYHDGVWVDFECNEKTQPSILLKNFMLWRKIPDHTVPPIYNRRECVDVPELSEEIETPIEVAAPEYSDMDLNVPSEDDIPEDCFDDDVTIEKEESIPDDLDTLRQAFYSLIKKGKLPVYHEGAEHFKLVVLKDATALTLSALNILREETNIPKKEILNKIDKHGMICGHEAGKKFLLAGIKKQGIVCYLVKNGFWNGDLPVHSIPEPHYLIGKPSTKDEWGIKDA